MVSSKLKICSTFIKSFIRVKLHRAVTLSACCLVFLKFLLYYIT